MHILKIGLNELKIVKQEKLNWFIYLYRKEVCVSKEDIYSNLHICAPHFSVIYHCISYQQCIKVPNFLIILHVLYFIFQDLQINYQEVQSTLETF